MNLRARLVIRHFEDSRFPIFYVTTQCNARCRTYFFARDLDRYSGSDESGGP